MKKVVIVKIETYDPEHDLRVGGVSLRVELLDKEGSSLGYRFGVCDIDGLRDAVNRWDKAFESAVAKGLSSEAIKIT